jgi:hypothetical protein
MSQEDLHNAIWSNINRKRFYLVEEGLLCSNNLQGKFGYNANTKIARAILAGSYEYPPDFDQASREIFEECADNLAHNPCRLGGHHYHPRSMAKPLVKGK